MEKVISKISPITKYHGKTEFVNLSSRSLIQLALAEEEGEDSPLFWDYVYILQDRGDREVLEAAKQLCSSNNVLEKTLGISILSRLGLSERSFPKECVDILLQVWAEEQDYEMWKNIAFALGNFDDPRRVTHLSKFKNYPIDDIRLAVVMGLSDLNDSLAIATLIELSDDPVPDIRDWAIFYLRMINLNVPKIREAFFQRLMKENPETNYGIYRDALLGLLENNDKRAIVPFLQELSRDRDPDDLQELLMGAEDLDDARKIVPVAKLKNHPSASVRQAVAIALSDREDPLAIATLIELSTDADDEVRDWATSAVGTSIQSDTPAIREALFQRLSNENPDTHYTIYGEALIGLLLRNDERAIAPLVQELSRDRDSSEGEDIATALSKLDDPRKFIPLIKLKDFPKVKVQLGVMKALFNQEERSSHGK
ncbi:MAG: HEAT repeat domain-containing protein [Cyanobacteria bacterium P01_E01_bin.42]